MKIFKPKQVKLNSTGLEKVLGDLEAQVMRVVWRVGKTTIRNVRDELERGGKILAFNTVMTIMNRLLEKGILVREREAGSYKYFSERTEKEFLNLMSSDILSSIVKDPALFSAAGFLNLIEEVDPKMLAELKKLISDDE